MPSVSWRSDFARSRRLMASTSMPTSRHASLGEPDLAWLCESRGQLVADVVTVGQLGDLPDVHDRLGQLDAGAVGEPQAIGVQHRGRSPCPRGRCLDAARRRFAPRRRVLLGWLRLVVAAGSGHRRLGDFARFGIGLAGFVGRGVGVAAFDRRRGRGVVFSGDA